MSIFFTKIKNLSNISAKGFLQKAPAYFILNLYRSYPVFYYNYFSDQDPEIQTGIRFS